MKQESRIYNFINHSIQRHYFILSSKIKRDKLVSFKTFACILLRYLDIEQNERNYLTFDLFYKSNGYIKFTNETFEIFLLNIPSGQGMVDRKTKPECDYKIILPA